VLRREIIPTLHATHVAAGVFDLARIPVIPTAKIGAGVFDATRVPNLPAGKITTGVIDRARLPDAFDALDIKKTLDVSGELRVGPGFRARPQPDGDGAIVWGPLHFVAGREAFATILRGLKPKA
jgi:hypothetical protein